MTAAEGMVLVLAVILAATAMSLDGILHPATMVALTLLAIVAAVTAVLHIAGIVR